MEHGSKIEGASNWANVVVLLIGPVYRASRNKWLLLYPRINGYLETDNSIR